MNQPLISVIVPIYNVESYLEQCIQSILNQSYTNLEILLIDDGSTDGSSQLCQQFLSKDCRLKYFLKENGGLSDARNYGIERATGEYLTFVDSDDWLSEDAIQLLMEQLETYQADMAIAGYYEYSEADGMFYFHIFEGDYFERVYTPHELFKDFPRLIGNDVSFTVVWGKLYKASLFENVKFRVGSYTEDEAINYKLYLQSNKIIHVNQAVYGNRKRQGTLSQVKNEKYILDTLKIFEERMTLLAITNGDVSGFVLDYRNLLRKFENDMRDTLGMTDTELHRRVKENLYLIEKYGHLD